MLWDPTKDKKFETKADPFTLDALIAWLEKQPANKRYCYLDNGGCMFAQYLLYFGYKRPLIGGFCLQAENLPRWDLPVGWDDIPYAMPRTFGAALDRARALRAAAES